MSDENTGQVSSTEAATGVIVVATLDGNSEESDPIEFVLIELTKPAVSSYRVRTGQVATFTKVLGHTYELKQAVSGVTLEVSDEKMGRVTSTQAATGVIVVATLDGNSEDSDPIEFVLIELTKPAVSSDRVKVGTAVTFQKVEGHSYELKQAVSGVTLEVSDEKMGRVTSTQAASGVVVVARLDDSSEDSDPIEFIEITKPVFFPGPSAPWDTPITFPKVPGYSYELKEEKTGVALSEYTSDKKQVTATQYAQNVIIVATDNGLSAESEPIEFTRQQGNTLSFAQASYTRGRGNITVTQTATKSGGVAGDTRNIRYSISPRRINVTSINSSSGKVIIAYHGGPRTYTITAELPRTAKYERSTATYTLILQRIGWRGKK